MKIIRDVSVYSVISVADLKDWGLEFDFDYDYDYDYDYEYEHDRG